jgi:hypothetical protein
MRRLTVTQHTVRCPVHDCTASLEVRTDADEAPSRRHRDVAACSLLTQAPTVPFARSGHFSDVAPPVSYLYSAEATPRHSTKVRCAKPCLDVLNAAEAGAAEPPRCSSGVSDALELVRQTQSPGMMRVLWMHSV